VQSVNGPAHTTIQGAPGVLGGVGAGAIRCARVASGSVLSGFTLTGGYTDLDSDGTEDRGGGAWCEPTAVLTNCIITSNSSDDDGSGVYGGTVYRSTISNNIGSENTDGAGAD